MGFKDRDLALVPRHKAADAESDAADPQDDLGLHMLFDGTRSGQDLGDAPPCLEPVEYVDVEPLHPSGSS